MGHPEASREEAERIPAVSVRLVSEMLSRLTSGHLEAERGDLKRAAARLPEVENLLHRGIACGALADPWNILGFQGLFPLSPAREDSTPDARLGELVQVVEQTFNLYARLSSEAAAAGDEELARSLTEGMERLAAWWDPFATVEVSDMRRVHGGEAAASARQVASALAGWRQRGEAAADLAFWRGQLDQFRSAKAFSLVVDALLRKGDFRAAMALLVSWVGQAEQVPLEEGAYSFHALALRWLLALTQPAGETEGAALPPAEERRALIIKFFDYLEANAEEFWEVPTLDVVGPEAPDEEEEDLYGAAYEGVTYEDSTDDSEGSVSDGGGPREEFDLEREGERLDRRLRFQTTLARLWQVAARLPDSPPPNPPPAGGGGQGGGPAAAWLRAARDKRRRMLRLLDAVHAQPLPDPGGAYDALVEYDRRRVLKDQLLYATIGACLHLTLAVGACAGRLAPTTRRTRRSQRRRGNRPRCSWKRRCFGASRRRPARRCRRSRKASAGRCWRCCRWPTAARRGRSCGCGRPRPSFWRCWPTCRGWGCCVRRSSCCGRRGRWSRRSRRAPVACGNSITSFKPLSRP